jgi:hypothetical protein
MLSSTKSAFEILMNRGKLAKENKNSNTQKQTERQQRHEIVVVLDEDQIKNSDIVNGPSSSSCGAKNDTTASLEPIKPPSIKKKRSNGQLACKSNSIDVTVQLQKQPDFFKTHSNESKQEKYSIIIKKEEQQSSRSLLEPNSDIKLVTPLILNHVTQIDGN